MHVSDIMSDRPVTVRPTATLGAVARTLAHHGVTALPVVDGRDRVVGVVSEADLIGHGPDAPRRQLTDPVSEVMGHRTVVVHPDTDLTAVSQIFATTAFKSIPVVDAADQVVGMVSRSDLVRTLGRDDELLEQDVSDLLARSGVRGCHVQVRHGVVSLTPPLSGPELAVVLDLLSATPGVSAVHAG
ncbi:MAG TPA: CBS domain-containing protein [Nocardioides sp.]|nr:CBS domain-containing protein [Nocardioides sp.]